MLYHEVSPRRAYIMAKHRKYKREEVIAALEAARGLVSLAADKLGVTQQAISYRILNDPEIAQAAKEIRERQTDLTEAKLFQAINNGDMTAIIFYLKTQAKSRGYVERMEHSGPVEVVVRYVDE